MSTTTDQDDVRILLEGDLSGARRSYPRVVKTISETPWAITLPMLGLIQELVGRRLAGEALSAVEIEERVGDRRADFERRHLELEPHRIEYEISSRSSRRAGTAPTTGQIAVIPLYGVIATRASLMSQVSSSGASIEDFQSMVRAALADPQVSSILIDIDSPGGSSDKVPEVAQELFESRGDKPIAAIANVDAGSAAYWIGSQVDEFACTPSGMVGSIGVYAAHQDVSAMLEAKGIKTTLVSFGAHKVELSPFGPLSADALAYVQDTVDSLGHMFQAAVARGRGVSVSKVRSDFGDGRMLMADPAASAGMIDRVATFDQMVARLARGQVAAGKPSSRSSSSSFGRGAPAARVELDELELHADDAPASASTCATCDHEASDHGDDGQGACTADGCDCGAMDDGDGVETDAAALELAASSSRLDELLVGATSRTVQVGDAEILVLDLGAGARGIGIEAANEIRAALEARADGRQVVVLADGTRLSSPDPSTLQESPAPAAGEITRTGHPAGLLHRRAVRTALREAATLAAEGTSE